MLALCGRSVDVPIYCGGFTTLSMALAHAPAAWLSESQCVR